MANRTARHRVLLLAEACNPEWVSVPLVGWSLVQAMSKLCDAHLVTQVRNREALERFGWREGREFTALDTESVAKLAWKAGTLLRGGAGKGWTTLTALAALTNYHFEYRVWSQFGKAISGKAFDVVHRITPLSPTVASPMASWCRSVGVPFVLGPLNGGIPWPKGFERARWQEREWLSYIRDLYRLLPYYHSTRQHASALLIGSMATWQQLPRTYRGRAFYMPENAIDPTRFPPAAPRLLHRPIRGLFVGRLVPYKGADMLLNAAAPLLKAGKLELTIVGDGPEKPALAERVQRLGLQSTVNFTGWLDHRQIRAQFENADLFLFPSVREFGGGVVLEAMAGGAPPVVVNYGGPGELVTPGTGWLVPLGSKDQIIASLAALLEQIIAAPEMITAKAKASVDRCFTHFTWEAKARRVLDIYDWVTGRTAKKPSFPMPIPDIDRAPNSL